MTIDARGISCPDPLLMLATFFTHHDALVFFAYLKEQNIPSQMMPTPRKISASCGACVRYKAHLELALDSYEIEAIYIEKSSIYKKIWENENI